MKHFERFALRIAEMFHQKIKNMEKKMRNLELTMWEMATIPKLKKAILNKEELPESLQYSYEGMNFLFTFEINKNTFLVILRNQFVMPLPALSAWYLKSNFHYEWALSGPEWQRLSIQEQLNLRIAIMKTLFLYFC